MLKPLNDQRVIDFAAYIDGKRNDSGIVHVADVDLMEIYRLAPHVVLFDVYPENRLKIRFVGTAVTKTYQRDVTGLFFDELILGTHTEKLKESYQLLLKSTKPRWTYTKIDVLPDHIIRNRHLHYAYERVSYPLFADDGQVARVISLLAFVSIQEAKADFEDMEIA